MYIYKKSIDILLLLYIAALAVFALPTNVFYANVIGVTLTGIYFSYKLIYKQPRIYFIKILIAYGVFVIFSLCSSYWSESFDYSMEQNFLNIKVFIILFIISNIVTELKNIYFIFYGILLAMFINYLIFFDLYTPLYETWLWVRFMGSTGNPNALAILSIFSIYSTILLIYLKDIKNIFLLSYLYINLALSIYMIIVTASKKGILFGMLLIFGYIISLIKDKKQFIKFFVGFTLIGLFIFLYLDTSVIFEKIDINIQRFIKLFDALSGDTSERSSEERLRFIEEGFLIGGDKPLLGHGINTFKIYFELYAHNNYIELFFGIGIIGLFIYYFMYFILIKAIMINEDDFLKYFLLFFTLILLLMDMALVSYYYKLFLIMLVASYEIIINSSYYKK